LDATNAKGTLDNSQIGSNKNVQINGLRLEGTDSSNYAIQARTTANVQPEYINSASFIPTPDTPSTPNVVASLSFTANSFKAPAAIKDLNAPSYIPAPVSSSPTQVLPGNTPSLAQQAIQGVTPKIMSQWSDVQVQSLLAAQVAAMEVPQLKQVIRLLNTESQIPAINPQVLSKLDLQTLSGLSNKQINAFTPEQLANMTKAQINYMMPILSPAQVNGLKEVFYFDKESSEKSIVSNNIFDPNKLVLYSYNDRIDNITPKVIDTATLPEVNYFKDIRALRSEIVKVIDQFRKAVNATDNAVESLDLSITQNNFIGFNSARIQLAKALVGGDLSEKEIAVAGGDPSIFRGLIDMTSTAFTGTPSLDTQNKIKKTINAIRNVAIKKGRDELEVQKTIAFRSGFNTDDFAAASDIPEFRPRGKKSQ
jgi:hypothetical protein